ncbi:MAG: twitching motility protein PilT [Bryobacteraceae bacterium]|jgi:predicted nucleic acid-binding protein
MAESVVLVRDRKSLILKALTIIATRCIESGCILLHSDRDFDPFAEHLGLSAAA